MTCPQVSDPTPLMCTHISRDLCGGSQNVWGILLEWQHPKAMSTQILRMWHYLEKGSLQK